MPSFYATFAMSLKVDEIPSVIAAQLRRAGLTASLRRRGAVVRRHFAARTLAAFKHEPREATPATTPSRSAMSTSRRERQFRAKSGQCATAVRTGQIDPKHAFKTGHLNGR
jgi:hypothetical protein